VCQLFILPLGKKEEESCLDVQFDYLTAVLLRIQVFWDVSRRVVPNVEGM
jgi:hypothetical protein